MLICRQRLSEAVSRILSSIEFFENTKENAKKVKLIDHPYVNKIINEITKILKRKVWIYCLTK